LEFITLPEKHYAKRRIVMCLSTRSKSATMKASSSFASKLDDFWLKFRISNIDVPASNLLVEGQPAKSFTSNLPKLSGALNKYCLLKGIGKSDQFFTVAKRNIGCVIDYVGDRPLDTYSTSDASSFRHELFRRKLSSTSVQRIFSTIRAAINITIQEDGLSCINAFAKTYLPNEERPKHPSLSNEDIQRVQKVCFDIADERRLLIALISDIGMRLSEALGLVWNDVQLKHQCPHIKLVPHPWRQLKTTGSKRLVPLVGEALVLAPYNCASIC
jgi:integrase